MSNCNGQTDKYQLRLDSTIELINNTRKKIAKMNDQINTWEIAAQKLREKIEQSQPTSIVNSSSDVSHTETVDKYATIEMINNARERMAKMNDQINTAQKLREKIEKSQPTSIHALDEHVYDGGTLHLNSTGLRYSDTRTHNPCTNVDYALQDVLAFCDAH